jgi:hypothetical protein
LRQSRECFVPVHLSSRQELVDKTTK